MFFTIRGVGTGVVFLDKHSTKRSTLKHVGQLDLTLPWWHGAWSSFRVERYTGLMHGMFCHIRDDSTVLMAARALHASTHNAKHDHVDTATVTRDSLCTLTPICTRAYSTARRRARGRQKLNRLFDMHSSSDKVYSNNSDHSLLLTCYKLPCCSRRLIRSMQIDATLPSRERNRGQVVQLRRYRVTSRHETLGSMQTVKFRHFPCQICTLIA